jgi:hypothetical protein
MALNDKARNLDTLLEAFQSDNLTSGDIGALSVLLDEILTAKPGDIAAGKIIVAGDRIAAAIVLRVLRQP